MTLPTFVYTKLFAVLTAVALGAAGGWTLNGWRLNSKLSDLRVQAAEEKSAVARAQVQFANEALFDIAVTAARMSKAVGEYQAIENKTSTKIEALRKEVRQYAKSNPLPADCRPDAVRVRKLADSIDAANTAIPK
jgi:hypothetical protein